jgi:hypothetical protein
MEQGRRFVWVFVFLATFANCGAHLGGVPGSDNDSDSSKGVLVTTIKANFSGEIFITGKNLRYPSMNIWVEPGSNFRMLTLPAGKYRWSQITTGTLLGGRRCVFSERSQFEIELNTINYVGDLEILIQGSVCQWAFFDHGRDARTFLQGRYPKLIHTYPFSWKLTEGTPGRGHIPDSVLEEGEPRPQPPNPRVVIAKVLTDTASFRDQLCACNDRICVGRVSHAMEQWQREFGLDENSPKLTTEEQVRLDEITKALNDCRKATFPRSDKAPSATEGPPGGR